MNEFNVDLKIENFLKKFFNEDMEGRVKILLDNSDMVSTVYLCCAYRVGNFFPYGAMQDYANLVSAVFNYAAENKDVDCKELLINLINSFMLADGLYNKDLRLAFYKSIAIDLNYFSEEDREYFWQIVPDFATRHLIEHPEDAELCKCYNLFRGINWCALLIKQPQFRDLCEKYEGFKKLIFHHHEDDDGSWHVGYEETISYWSKLLEYREEFRDKCAEYKAFGALHSMSPNALPRESVEAFLNGEDIPYSTGGFDDEELEEAYKMENAWYYMLMRNDHFDAEFVADQGYCTFDEEQWEILLAKRPELIKYKENQAPYSSVGEFDFEDDRYCENDDWHENWVGDICLPDVEIDFKFFREVIFKEE